MDFTSMYREGRIFPLGGIIKTTPVSIGSFVALLYRSSKVTVVFFAYFALPQIYDIARFAVQCFCCVYTLVVYSYRLGGVHEWTLFAVCCIALLIWQWCFFDTELLVLHEFTPDGGVFLHSHYDLRFTNYLL